MKPTAPVYGFACPKCEVPAGVFCRRVRKLIYREPLPELLNAHAERYAVWRAWEQPELPLDSVRGVPYKRAS